MALLGVRRQGERGDFRKDGHAHDQRIDVEGQREAMVRRADN